MTTKHQETRRRSPSIDNVHRVEIWRFSLSIPASELQGLKAVLSDDEVTRANRFVQKAHADYFIAARGMLRLILGQHTDSNPAALRFETSATGKPFLSGGGEDNPSVHFNITHSGNAAAVAVCRTTPVGIDIERVRPVRDGLAQRYFAASEVAALEALPEPERLDAFFRCWTCKEAFLKATGEGIRRGLDSFVVSIENGVGSRLISIDQDRDAAESFWLTGFDAGPGASGAVCVLKGQPEQRVDVIHRDVSEL